MHIFKKYKFANKFSFALQKYQKPDDQRCLLNVEN